MHLIIFPISHKSNYTLFPSYYSLHGQREIELSRKNKDSLNVMWYDNIEWGEGEREMLAVVLCAIFSLGFAMHSRGVISSSKGISVYAVGVLHNGIFFSPRAEDLGKLNSRLSIMLDCDSSISMRALGSAINWEHKIGFFFWERGNGLHFISLEWTNLTSSSLFHSVSLMFAESFCQKLFSSLSLSLSAEAFWLQSDLRYLLSANTCSYRKQNQRYIGS